MIVLFIFPNGEKHLEAEVSATPPKRLAWWPGFAAAPLQSGAQHLNYFPASQKCGSNEIQRLIPIWNLGNNFFACIAILKLPLEILSHLHKKVAFQTDTFKVPSFLQRYVHVWKQICTWQKSFDVPFVRNLVFDRYDCGVSFRYAQYHMSRKKSFYILSFLSQ